MDIKQRLKQAELLLKQATPAGFEDGYPQLMRDALAKIEQLEGSEVKIYRLLIRFNGGNARDAWVTERAYTAADAITQTLTKQRFAWPDVQVLEVVPFETV